MSADERTASRADALVMVAESFLSQQAPKDGSDSFQVVVPHQGRCSRRTSRTDRCWRPRTVLRLACDASLYCIHENARGDVLDVGRTTRRIPKPLRRALRHRDGGCRFAACGRRRGVDAHHVQHWLHLGPTKLANLVLLCRRHHTLVHEGGFDLRMNSQGQPEFRTPEGAALLEFPALVPSAHDPAHWHRAAVSGSAVASRWAGEQVDVGYVAGVIAQQRRQPARQKPEPPQPPEPPELPEPPDDGDASLAVS